jgi:DNA-binding winged helix-turn-helix (wHTH) protein
MDVRTSLAAATTACEGSVSSDHAERLRLAAPRFDLRSFASAFGIGRWRVDPSRCAVSSGALERHLEPKVMDVLVLLARAAGRVVSRDELLACVWPDTAVVDGVLSRCICQLRRTLGGGAGGGGLVETIPKRGYRVVAPVSDLPAPGVAGGGDRARVLVGPFRDVPARRRGAAGEGLAELLLVEVARLAGVAASHWSPGARPSVAGPALRIEGAVLWGRGRLDVVARAVEPHRGRQVWARVYRSAAGDLLAVQHALARRIAAGVAPLLLRPRTAAAKPRVLPGPGAIVGPLPPQRRGA